MLKKIAVATYYLNAAKFYGDQLKYFFGEYVDIETFCFYDRTIEKGIEADIIVIPSVTIFEAVKKYLLNDGEIIIAQRTLTKNSFDKIKRLSEGVKGILVNVSAEMALETISLIYQLGARHIELSPYHPGMKEIPNVDIAITPGESKYVPENITNVIDLGDRVLDISTIMDIAVKLGINHNNLKNKISKYFKEIVPISYGLEKILGKSNRLESQFNVLLKIIDEGIIGVNNYGIINYVNKSSEKLLGIDKNNILGKYYKDVFPHIPFDKVIDDKRFLDETLIKINEIDFIVKVVPIIDSDILYGAISILKKFSDVEKKQHKLRIQLLGKGHRAKYTFEDIVGDSKELIKTKKIAKRMAKSDSSILIIGESGTGKELFAQSIHNCSNRKDFQFVAVNCAALPENLLESELFGYEEGAFTGAKKGGKPGLFELAHMGTLFLDEIGEMPLALQARLLRVLQEKEVMRIGGDRVINVNVRIIAATNRDLKIMVEEGKFRKDLYFRLNVLPLKIPSLRERKEDILLLIDEFKKNFKADFVLTSEVINVFLNHSWEGNIRELRNYIEYLSNLEEKVIDICHLPFGSNEKIIITETKINNDKDKIEIFIDKYYDCNIKNYVFVLSELNKAYENKCRMGRRSLEKIAKCKGLFLTEQEIRSILHNLEKNSLVIIGKGRSGTKITELGKKVLKKLKNLMD